MISSSPPERPTRSPFAHRFQAAFCELLQDLVPEAGLVSGEPLTVTGRRVADNLVDVRVLDDNVIRPISRPYHKEGGIAILKGNLAPEGAVVKQSAVAPEMWVNQGRARVFESEEAATEAILGGRIKGGDIVVIRYKGPKGGPRHAGDAHPHLFNRGHGA